MTDVADDENVKLWLLRPAEKEPHGQDKWGPWDPWYDKAFGFVVRAETEEQARTMADAEAGDENFQSGEVDDNHPWLHAELSTCVPLIDAGETGIVIRDFRGA